MTLETSVFGLKICLVIAVLTVAACSSPTTTPTAPRTMSSTSPPTTIASATSSSTTMAPPTPSATTTTMAPRPYPCDEPASCSHPSVGSALWELPVLSIRFLPDADGDGTIDVDSTGYVGTVDSLRQRIEELDTAGSWWMTESTRYRGYAVSSEPSLGFSIIDSLEFIGAVPIGEAVPGKEGWYRPDYRTILTGLGVCDWVDDQGVREIWMWTQHHGEIEPAESNMWSPVGDISNSERTDDLPPCGHSYTVYNYNFARSVAEMLHNHGHQAEALFGRGDPVLFWDHFVGGRTNDGGLVEPFRCGWTHTAPNGQSHYDTYDDRVVVSDCLHWTPGGGTVSEVNCATWFESTYGDAGCFDDGGLAFYVWWFQSIPGAGNGLTFEGDQLADWWVLFADLESVTAHRSWLLEP